MSYTRLRSVTLSLEKFFSVVSVATSLFIRLNRFTTSKVPKKVQVCFLLILFMIM